MKSSFCQSCGMPMKHDPSGGGTEKSGSKTTTYCSYCYQEGAFVNPEIDTPQKMQAFCIEKMREAGTPRVLAWLFTRSIPRLERWRTTANPS